MADKSHDEMCVCVRVSPRATFGDHSNKDQLYHLEPLDKNDPTVSHTPTTTHNNFGLH